MRKFSYILKFTDGPLKGKSMILSQSEYTIGREEDNSIRLSDKLISKHHCVIVRTDDGLFIIDRGSRNGTFLNGFKLQPNTKYPLQPNSEIEIGQSTIAVVFERIKPADEKLIEKVTYDAPIPLTKKKGTPPEGIKPLSQPSARPGKTTIPFSIDSSRNLQAIYTLLNKVVGMTDRQSLVEKTMDIIMSFIRPERGCLFLREDLRDENYFPRVTRTREEKKAQSPVQISKTVINKVLDGGDSILSTEIPSDQRFSGAKSLVSLNVNSIVCAPIKTKTAFHGLMYLDTTSRTVSFKQDDLELVAAFGIQLGIMMENLQLIADFQELFLGVINTLVNIIETKDEYTRGHSERVTKISLAIGKAIGLDKKEIETLHVSALLHDIGKIAIPEEILKKPEKLTLEEFSIIKKHPTIGTELVKELKNFDEISKGILYHHERFDGHGYPSGASGKDIPFNARIIAIADSFDAMTSNRAYRERLDDQNAIDEINRNQGKQFDAEIVKIFCDAYDRKLIPSAEQKFPSLVQLRKLTINQ